jgi:hypothetical protein
MKVNVYNEELTDRVELTSTTAKTGAKFFGLQFFLHSPEQLHAGPDDDDQSAIVLWSDSRQKLLDLLRKAIEGVNRSVSEGE